MLIDFPLTPPTSNVYNISKKKNLNNYGYIEYIERQNEIYRNL